MLAAIVWFLVSTILLTLPGNDFPQENWLEKIWFDKWVHIGMFAIMTWLWCIAIGKGNRQKFYRIGMTCLLYGVAMEFVQKYFIPNRSFDVGDIIADAAGAIAGIWYSLRRYKKN